MAGFRTVAALGATLLVTLLHGDAAANEAVCNADIARASETLMRSHEAHIKRCLKQSLNEPCLDYGFHITASENALRARITTPGGACDTAVNVDGVSLSDFGPGAMCRDAGGFESCEDQVPTIATLDDLADCLICLHDRMTDDLEKRIASSNRYLDGNESRCIRSLYGGSVKATRAGRKAVEKCALGGTQPFACPVDDALVYANAAAVDYLGPDLVSSTLAAGTDPKEVVANPAAGLAYATSALDDTVTFFDGTSVAYAFGSFAGSTFAVEEAGRLAVDPIANRLFVGSDSTFTDATTTFDATTGAFINGTQAQSTFPWITSGGMIANPNSNVVLTVGGAAFYYDGLTGAPLVWGPNITMQATGPSPVAVEVMQPGP